MSLGVPAAATKPHHVSISKPGKVSLKLGKSGRLAARRAVVTASAFSLPEAMLGAALARLSMLKSTWPDSKASWAGLPPL